ncbi:MAG: ATP-binding protein [Prochloraceae cyanobacterium]
MKLKTKILLGYSVILTLLVLVCGWGIINLRRLGQASEGILRENYRSIQAAENTLVSLERQENAILIFLLEDPSRGREEFRENQLNFLQWLARAKDNVTIATEREILADLETRYKEYLAAFDRLQLRQNQIDNEANKREYYYQNILPLSARVRESAIDLRELNQKTMIEASKNTQKISHQAILSTAIAGAGAASLGLTFSLLLSNRLVKPLREMILATGKIAEGNYDVAVNVRSQDELGRLGKEITLMSQKLKAFHDLNVGKVINEKQRSEAIIESISDAIVVVDAEYKIIAINPIAADLTNTNSKLAIGNHFLDVINHQELYKYIKKTAETGRSPEIEDKKDILSLERGDRVRYYKFTITPVTTTEGNQLGVILLLQDITKLKEIDQLKSEFVATASHELRTPLTGMSMSLNLLLEAAANKLNRREIELLKTAEEDVERLRSLVNELLDLSKIESGKIEMDFDSVEIKNIAAKVIDKFQVQAEDKEVAIEANFNREIPKVKADPNKIAWILTNLISNALRYSDRGGKITVGAKNRGSWVDVFVADNGAGIAPEYQSKIFDKFVQVKTEKDLGGSGLGLAICKEIVTAHGGKIWVTSEPGEGSTFTFTLPVEGGQILSTKSQV